MKTVPERVSKAWETRQEAIVLSTVDQEGMPNAIYATCVSKYSESIFLIADNCFDKTRKNILAGSKASLLFITREGKSYQVKGSVTYWRNGDLYEDIKKWNPERLPGYAVTALSVDEVYSGSEKLL